MAKRHSQRSKFAKDVKAMLMQYGLEAVRRNAHTLGGSEQDAIRVCIFWLSNERPK